MQQYDLQLMKNMLAKILETAPDAIFLEAGHPAEYMPGQWMRQDFQFVDKRNDTHYRTLLTIHIAEIERSEEMMRTLTLPELMRLVEKKDDREKD